MHHVWYQYPHLVIQTHCIRILSIKFCTQSKLLKPLLFNFSGIFLLEIIASIVTVILLSSDPFPNPQTLQIQYHHQHQ
ncbi:hypothetical protein RHGRI_023944 [Rhododendron griersonianum]|uniref:Uncharacterized protein n=1 Tax=Rhododendron griersonianum TaxID=479676 RepID=A0AAV6J5J4_9ERIC|nr:hypothetical protein RHGRI_023944 [Rhododendron griersonianum]